MTTQIGDIYKYDKVQYTCLEVSNKAPFNPWDYGFQPSEYITSCIRGFWCEYEIADNRLILQKLHIHDANDYYPMLNGVSISPTERIFGHQTYNHLNIALPYTGKVLLAAEYIEEYWTNKGYEWPYGYRKLCSLEFDDGKLTRTDDHCETARIIREMLESEKKPEHDWGEEFIETLPADTREKVWWIKVRKDRGKENMREFIEWLEENGMKEDAEAFREYYKAKE